MVVEKVNNPSCNGRHKPVENTKSTDLNVDVPVEKERVDLINCADAEFTFKDDKCDNFAFITLLFFGRYTSSTATCTLP